jgi:glycosyltransferase involved in cell wall biosynthesis
MADDLLVAPSTTNPAARGNTPFRAAQAIDPSLVWVGTVDNPTGYADEMRGFLRTMEAAGYEPALRTFQGLRKRAGLSARERAFFERQEARTLSGPTVAIHHYVALRALRVEGAVNVSRTMFETDSVPESRLGILLERDQIWVPCEFNVETFVRGGVPEDKLRVVGGTMDFDLYDPATTEPLDLGVPDDHFVFVTNFAFAERKAWKQLIRAWAKAFGPDDGVCLVLKTHSETQSDDFVNQRMNAFFADELGVSRDAMAPIVVKMDMLATAKLPSLYAAADAYVLASRGEAWGRPFMEAMAMGLPTIASRWSGNLEFMNDGNSFLVDGELVSCEDVAYEVFGEELHGHSWFEPDVDHLAETMRKVAADPAAARAHVAGARDELMTRFGPEPTARRLAELAREAYELHGELRSQPVHSAVRGPFGSKASLGVVNDVLVNELIGRGHNVRREVAHSDTALPDGAPGITQSWPPRFDPVTGGPTVAMVPWEFGAPPRDWVDQVRSKVDRVWVNSHFTRDGYVAGGMPEGLVEVIPLGVDHDVFTPDGPAFELPSTAGCTFLFVGGTTWRKGADVLLAAWERAFGPDDDVQLVIKDFGTATHYRNQTAGAMVRALAARDDVAPVVYMDYDLPFSDIPSLYRAADVIVLPYRGEGFCLPALEAMACGVPVIHNGEGPTGEFVGGGGWALPATRIPLPPESNLPDLAYPGYVHEVDPDDLAAQLRAVAADAAGRRERAAEAIVQASRYTHERFVDGIEESLATLVAEDLPLARNLRRTEIESREHTVIFAPDWNDESSWAPALTAWASAVSADDPVTLALHVPDADAEAIGGRVVASLEAAGHAADTLPDLALCPFSEATAVALSASADAVLADAATDRSARPDLFRRARRVVEANPESVRALVAEWRDR